MNSSTEIPKDLVELMSVIHTRLPDEYRAIVAKPLDKVVEGSCNMRRAICQVQEILSDLRLEFTYLQFDLEATRRERDAAEERLNDS